MRAERAGRPRRARARAHCGEEGARRDDLAYRGRPFAAGVVYNEVTAAAVVETVAALLPGAGRARLSVPAPFGLPGGYPVAIEDGVLELEPATGRAARRGGGVERGAGLPGQRRGDGAGRRRHVHRRRARGRRHGRRRG